MRKIIGLSTACLIFVIAISWYVFSPQWTLNRIASAARSGNIDLIISYIDFPALRENARSEAKTNAIRELMSNDTDGFGALAAVVAVPAMGAVLDQMLSPEGLKAAWTDDQGRPNSMMANLDEADIDRVSFSKFLVVLPETKKRVIFERRGLGWSIVAFPGFTSSNSPGRDEPESGSGIVADTSQTADNDTIPAQFYGVWAPTLADCEPYGLHLVSILKKNIDYYESHGEVERVTVANEGIEYVARLTFEGEGNIWQANVSLQRDGPNLILTHQNGGDTSQPTENTLVRCP